MTGPDRFGAAAALGVLPKPERCAELLEAVVDLAQATFAAAASSITLLDEVTDELVFAAVVGRGADRMIGTRFPSGVGIAGWALSAQQALEVNQVAQDPRFAADVAERGGYIPQAIMVAPLVAGERSLGVLSVLDRADRAPSGLEAMQLLSLFAHLAATSVDVVQRIERAQAIGAGDDALAAVPRLVAALDRLEGRERQAGIELLTALERVVSRR